MPAAPSTAATSSTGRENAGDTRGEPAKPPAVSPHVKCSDCVIHRGQLKNAPYNPRTISDSARKKLRANIERVGLLQGPIWNERTGNIVGGHQRVKILDSLHGSADYLLPVSKVDLDEATEKAQNVFLNNGEAMGEFDLEKLQAMFCKDMVQPAAAGFEPADIYQLFGDDAAAAEPRTMADLAEQVRKSKEMQAKIAESIQVREDKDFYLVIFETHAERLKFLGALGLEDNRYVNGRVLSDRLFDGAAGDGDGERGPTAQP